MGICDALAPKLFVCGVVAHSLLLTFKENERVKVMLQSV